MTLHRQFNSTLPVRETRLSRSPIARSGETRTPRKRKPRTASEFARIYHSRKRVLWVKARRCIAARHACVCVGEMQNAHTENGGMGRKGPYTSIVPACFLHHTQMHQMGARWFEARYDLSLKARAAVTQRAWRASTGEAA